MGYRWLKMGYRAWIEKSEFNIPSQRITEALTAVMESNGSYETPKVAAKKVKHFEHLPPMLQLIEVANATYGLKLIPNKSGDIEKISYEWEKMHNDEAFWLAIAPFVKSGSYVEWCGEDGSKWRWIFRNGETKQVSPVMTWPE